MDYKVSVIIPYNHDRGYLKDAVDSCSKQDGFRIGKDYEIILQKGDCVVAKNVNDAVAKAKGKYIKKCDEDDMLTPNCLRDLYEFAEGGGYDFVCANAMNFSNETGERLVIKSRLPDTISEYAFDRTINISSGLYLRSTMLKFKVNEDLWTGEDFDLILRMADAGCRFGYLDRVVYQWREWYENKSRNDRLFRDKKKNQIKIRREFIEDITWQYEFNRKPINR